MATPSDEKQIAGVEVAQLERIFRLLREKLPLVFEANRYFEEKTGFHNQAGANNLVDALSHFSTLIENADELGPEGQAEQVAHLEDHLRRSMMEAFEQVLKFRLSDAAALWQDYMREAHPLLERGVEIPGAIELEQLAERREKITSLLEIGRQSKRMTSWEDWEEGTGALVEACEQTDDLIEELERSIASAHFYTRQRRIRLIAIVAAVAFALGIALGILLF